MLSARLVGRAIRSVFVRLPHTSGLTLGSGPVGVVASLNSNLSSSVKFGTEVHTSSRFRERAGTSLALCPPSIASTVGLLYFTSRQRLGFHLQSGFSVDVGGVIETWPSQAWMVLISTPARRRWVAAF